MAYQGLLYLIAQKAKENAQRNESLMDKQQEETLAQGRQPAAAGIPDQGLVEGQVQDQGGGISILDLYEGGKYSPSKYVRDVKGEAFDAVAGGLGQDTLAGGAGDDTMAGGGQAQPKQRQVDETSFLEDFLSSRLTGEPASRRKDRNLQAHERDAANYLAENPNATYEDYQKAGGKAGAGAFKELQQGSAVRSKQATEAKYGEEEIARAHKYNNAVRNYFASDGKATDGIVAYANEYLGDMLGGGKMESLKDNGDGSYTAVITGKDGKKIEQSIPQGQFRTLLAGDQAVNQKLATALRQGQMETYKRLKAQDIDDDLAWKTAFGENKPKTERPRIVGHDAKGLPVYEGDKMPDQLYAGGLSRATPKDPTPQRVKLADGREVWVKPGETGGLPIEGTGKAPEKSMGGYYQFPDGSVANTQSEFNTLWKLHANTGETDEWGDPIPLAYNDENARKLGVRFVPEGTSKDTKQAVRSLGQRGKGEVRSSVQPSDSPPVEGARRAGDGNWYVQKNGKWYRVEQ
jgi:hypothetical protein